MKSTIDENDEILFTEHEVHEVIERMLIEILEPDNNVLIEVKDEHLSSVTEVTDDYEDVEVARIIQI